MPFRSDRCAVPGNPKSKFPRCILHKSQTIECLNSLLGEGAWTDNRQLILEDGPFSLHTLMGVLESNGWSVSQQIWEYVDRRVCEKAFEHRRHQRPAPPDSGLPDTTVTTAETLPPTLPPTRPPTQPPTQPPTRPRPPTTAAKSKAKAVAAARRRAKPTAKLKRRARADPPIIIDDDDDDDDDDDAGPGRRRGRRRSFSSAASSTGSRLGRPRKYAEGNSQYRDNVKKQNLKRSYRKMKKQLNKKDATIAQLRNELRLKQYMKQKSRRVLGKKMTPAGAYRLCFQKNRAHGSIWGTLHNVEVDMTRQALAKWELRTCESVHFQSRAWHFNHYASVCEMVRVAEYFQTESDIDEDAADDDDEPTDETVLISHCVVGMRGDLDFGGRAARLRL